MRILKNLKDGISSLSPGYFALVMATGIVSVAAHLYHLNSIASFLFILNIVAYILLSIATVARLIAFPKFFLNDFSSSSKNSGFLTSVAATNILGYQFIIFTGNFHLAAALFVAGSILWFVLIYSLLTVIIIQRNKPEFNQGISGSWLLIIVATESVSVLATALSVHFSFAVQAGLFIALCLFLLGTLLYLIIITLIFYRLAFFRLRAQDLVPAYWINMGAVAIITLAGSELILHAGKWDYLSSIDHFIHGFTLLFWTMGTWWIPLIIMLGFWRYFIKKVPIRYNAQYWGMVFPIGMYTVCTHQLAIASDFRFLLPVPAILVFIAIAVWAITAAGMVRKLVVTFLSSPQPQ